MCIEIHVSGLEGSSDDKEPKIAAVWENAVQTGRQDRSRWLAGTNRFREQARERCYPDIRADHHGNLCKAPESHEGLGKSVGGTTVSPGQTRYAAMRKHFNTAEPLGS